MSEPVTEFASIHPMSSSDWNPLSEDVANLLGRCTPLPELYEEVLRHHFGGKVTSTRFRRMTEMAASFHTADTSPQPLLGLLLDTTRSWEERLLAATLWAHGALSPDPLIELAQGDYGEQTLYAMATFPTAPINWYLTVLEERLADAPTGASPHAADPLTLLCFLKGLQDGALCDELFANSVLHGGVLHPDITAHRPLRRLHRLLDYLGLSEEFHIQGAYRRLLETVWPIATAENWAQWHWVTLPGGPEIFPKALAEINHGDWSLIRIHELKHAILPPPNQLHTLLATADPVVMLLLAWLRPGGPITGNHPAASTDAIAWLHSSNIRATAMAYQLPGWWHDWVTHGFPVARDLLTLLQTIPLPHAADEMRHQWIERYLIPQYRRICANLLLAQATCGERTAALQEMASAHDVPAIHALGMLTDADESIITCLHHLRRTGGTPVQAAATRALARQAHLRGLPGIDEMERQHLLAAAWDLGPLANERVQTGWQEGWYRLRLSLHRGKVELEVLGPFGQTTQIPPAVRASASYREARAAQRTVQHQYRIFKQHLEQFLLERRPIAIGEFRFLLSHPIFAHLAERLIWLTATGQSFIWNGPDRWETRDGQTIDLAAEPSLTLMLAHPITLAHRQELVHWQALAADHRLEQPFKQLFREIYTVSGETGTHCTRFAGRPIHPQRAYALLRSTGYAPGTGVARKTWPDGTIAHLCWAQGVVSHDLFGPQRKVAVTTGDIWFTRDGAPRLLEQVDPIIFSETLRTADLLTTRAAIGEADLTSREAVALRAALLREVARSFDLTNLIVREEGQYALILGARASYRINLASGTIMLEPEGRQILLPEHDAGWRPSEGDDAMSHLLGIILTLVHDERISDLTFLAQITPHPAG